MIERLQRALAHIDELPPEVQEELATLIEERTEPAADGGAADGGAEAEAREEADEQRAQMRTNLAGAWSDLLYDDEFAAFERMRHEVPPSPPFELDDDA